MDYKDYYKTLGVSKNATEKELRSAYRKLARQYHPDVNPGNRQAEARFKEINEAYQVLSDPEKRAKYDRYGADWERFQRTGSGQTTDFGRWYTGRSGGYTSTSGTAGFDTSGFSDFFRTLFGNISGSAGRTTTTTRTQAATRGDDLEQPIEITAEEAFSGTKRILQLSGEITCPECNGVGIKNTQLCNTCHGRGTISEQNRRIEVTIPQGVYDGARIRVAGKGEPGYGGAPSGDLYLRIKIKKHPKFEFEGRDVYVNQAVDLYTCLLGGEVAVPTPAGKKLMLTIPANTNNGQSFRLRGQGMPALNNPSQKGDLIVRVTTELPHDLSEQQRDLLKQVRDSDGGTHSNA